jgi:hypothetical protein
MRILIIFLFVLFIAGCSKDNNKTPTTSNDKQLQEQNQKIDTTDDNPADTNLTPEEKFSTSVMVDFLDGDEDEDLEGFLEEEVFKFSANYTGAAVIGISPSTWLLSLEKDNSTKNYLIQKYVDFKTNEYYFRMRETALSVTDVFSRIKVRTGAGE